MIIHIDRHKWPLLFPIDPWWVPSWSSVHKRGQPICHPLHARIMPPVLKDSQFTTLTKNNFRSLRIFSPNQDSTDRIEWVSLLYTFDVHFGQARPNHSWYMNDCGRMTPLSMRVYCGSGGNFVDKTVFAKTIVWSHSAIKWPTSCTIICNATHHVFHMCCHLSSLESRVSTLD